MGIFTRILAAFGYHRSLDNPSTPLSAGADWLYDAFGAMRAGSGMRVSRETAMTYAAVWRACALISRDVARLPFGVQKWKNPGWVTDKEHFADYLVRNKPNSEILSYPFRQTMMYHVLLMGNAYSYIYRNPAGEADELVILLPDMTYPIRENGELWYVTKVNGEMRRLDPSSVIHIKGIGYDGLAGYSVVQKGRESFGLGMAQNRYAGIFFRNNAQPSIVLQHPASLSDTALKHLKESWTAMQGGLDNAHKPKILEEGMTVDQISINARDAQLIESRQFEIREIANWFNLPPHKLGDNSRLAYNSLEQENQAYLDDALEPWLIQIEQEFWDKILTEKQKRKGSHRFQFERHALMSANLEAKEKFYTSIVNNGLRTANHVAEIEGWNPLPPEIGDRYRMPVNIAILGDDGIPLAPAAPPGGDGNPPKTNGKKPGPGQGDVDADPDKTETIRAHRELIADTARRMARRIAVSARSASKSPGKFNDFLDGLAKEHERAMLREFGPTLKAVYAALRMGDPCPGCVVQDMLSRAKTGLLEASGRLTILNFQEGIEEFLAEFEQKEPENVANSIIRAETGYFIALAPEMKLFVYGTFLDHDLLKSVLQHSIEDSWTMTLRGFSRLCGTIPGGDKERYCTLVEDDAGRVEGKVFFVNDDDLKKLDSWEERYTRRSVLLDQEIPAYCYTLRESEFDNLVADGSLPI